MNKSQKTINIQHETLRRYFNQISENRENWMIKNEFYHGEHYKYLKFLIPEGCRILDLGSGLGRLLDELKPTRGVGVDISENMVDLARAAYPDLEFFAGNIEDPEIFNNIEGTFDYIILSNTVGYLEDIAELFESLHKFCDRDTRIVIGHYSWLWEPTLWLAEAFGLRMPRPKVNWLSPNALKELLKLTDFDPIKTEWRQLLPRRMFGLGTLLNRYVASLPGIRRACLQNYLVARSSRRQGLEEPSATVVIPAKNEAGNIEPAITRMPDFCADLEIIFVEGGSGDDTAAEIERVIGAYPQYDIKFLKQESRGKWPAVKQGFDAARGDILMILDADLTMPPEDLPKFYRALVDGKGEFINGSRMVYPQEVEAMRTLNRWANSTFSLLFTWLLNQRFTDTLCGTKVITKANFRKIEKYCGEFEEYDPFGDFYLIFGAQKQNLKIIEVPIRYKARQYGETQISRFAHGWQLLRMVVFAFRRLKAF